MVAEAEMEADMDMQMDAETNIGHKNINYMGEEVDMEREGGAPKITLGGSQGVADFSSRIIINNMHQGSGYTFKLRSNIDISIKLGEDYHHQGLQKQFGTEPTICDLKWKSKVEGGGENLRFQRQLVDIGKHCGEEYLNVTNTLQCWRIQG